MTFLADLAGFAAGVAGVINSVFTIVDACLSWLYGGIINGTKAKKWGRYRSWLIMVPWMVPFLYAFMFIRVSDNEWLSAVVIIAAIHRISCGMEFQLCCQCNPDQYCW